MLVKVDMLDYAILNALKQTLSEEPTLEVAEYLEEEDLNGILLGISALEDILCPDFFKHVPISFNLLRHRIDWHDVNPVNNSIMMSVPLSDTKGADPRLSAQIWFLLFLGSGSRQLLSP